jgi:hypothetical protein
MTDCGEGNLMLVVIVAQMVTMVMVIVFVV